MEYGSQSTRRQLLAGTGLTVGAALAGCASMTESDNTENSNESTRTEQADSYEACIEPVGCQTFESVPETYIVNNGEWADMAFALGQRDGFLTSTNMIPGFLFEPFGLDVPPRSETESMSAISWDKEIFYEREPDVILMDPHYMHGTGWDDSWDESDTREISENVAPFFGNNILRRRDFHDYKLYSLYGAFERLAELFQERERYEAMASVHDDLQREIQSRLPSDGNQPTIGLVNSATNPSEGTFYPMNTDAEGIEMKPYQDLGIESSFTPELVENGTIDYEQLLEVDPEIIVVHWGIKTTGNTDSFSLSAFHKQFVEPMETDPVGSQLTAVEAGNIYPGAFGSQGPLVNLLQTEMVAQQLYPEEFGEFEPERFPEVADDKQLFDRQRVKDIIQGRF
ncbi:ferrichrome ABC transporter substrate-binding protein [Haloarcula taiwanensis]|uniref:Ferrichrome ABC transporter substrate-binding protein n=1 Tax=Haloarcula taiwanensis TaxID=1932004 RepID=A0A2H4ZXM8_9EURY|nr:MULTISPECIES: ABC transporter substrate-binding protein [Haloarcula]AUG47223.1 ferrichrome ABC transporter substrate-binding protein [Haloarcula taiwanensis]KZX48463.1 ferrichrome ABC transporter substrate-binding protein [Haloarcula sp. K1]